MGSIKLHICLILTLAVAVYADKVNECSARQIAGASVVCVCTADYCDEITWEAPAQGTYNAYTSSESGFRFRKVTGDFIQNNNTDLCSLTLDLLPDVTYQTVEGFGGSVTDSAALNWKNLSEPLQKKLIDAYFSKTGLEYNMLRLPIGGCDFSTHPYAYNELPLDDINLSNFSLASEDYDFKIPMIKAIKAVATAPIEIVATTWSPAPWMKTNNAIGGGGFLKPEYFQTYADYHLKFLEKYAEENVDIWAITTTNEPVNSIINLSTINSLGWTPGTLGRWIANNLGPTLRNSTFNNTKILAVDDQRVFVPIWFDLMAILEPAALEWIDGIAVHFYLDTVTSTSILTYVTKNYPDKFIINTEACNGLEWQKEKVILGSWARAVAYITDIIQDMNFNVIGWLDWNLCLDKTGGPNWIGNLVDSPILVYPEEGHFLKQPMFYAMGHFSKFIPRGSKRIGVVTRKSLLSTGIENVSFLTPRDTVVTVLYNKEQPINVCVNIGSSTAVVNVEANSIVTVEMPYKK